MESQTYFAHGLTLRSEVPIPGLPTAGSEAIPDVEIWRKPIDNQVMAPKDRGVLWSTTPGGFQIAIDNVAEFVVRDGKEIHVDAAQDATEHDISTYLLGSVMGALLFQRGIWPLHASAIETDKGAVLFAGRSGAGKSTLAAALCQQGYSIICDDISAVKVLPNGTATVAPGIPRIKLSKDAASHLGIDVRGSRRDHARGKFLTRVEAFTSRPTTVHRIFCLDLTDEKDCSVRKVSSAEAAGLLSRATYRRKFMKGLGLHDVHFSRMIALARSATVSLVHRPTELSGLDNTLGTIEELLR